jgi:hypothetical protein
MAEYRKPIPKTQREISEGLQDAFDRHRGNPNKEINPNKSQTGIEFNRSTKISSKGDNIKNLFCRNSRI